MFGHPLVNIPRGSARAPHGMLQITLPEENPRLNELQRSLLSAQHGTMPNESVLSGHSARNRAQVLHPGGSVVAGSIGRGSIGRLSRFSTTAGDTLSRKAHVISLIANTALLLGKSYVYWQSQSMAVLASLIDSAVDMVAQGVLMVANRIVTDRRDEQNVRYPAGRSKLESIGVAAWRTHVVLGSGRPGHPRLEAASHLRAASRWAFGAQLRPPAPCATALEPLQGAGKDTAFV